MNNQSWPEETEGGIVFFGDGNWGVFKEECEIETITSDWWWPEIFATPILDDSAHIWILEMDSNNNEVRYFAFDLDNHTIPSSIYA